MSTLQKYNEYLSRKYVIEYWFRLNLVVIIYKYNYNFIITYK